MSQPRMNAEAMKHRNTKSPKRTCFRGSSLINRAKATETRAAKMVKTKK